MQVTQLLLGSNQLSGTVPYMPNIKVLDMSRNRLTEPRFHAVPATLQILYLDHNSLTGALLRLGDSTLDSMELTLLDASHNKLSRSLPRDMPPNLSVLDIAHNAFTGTLPSGWSRLQKMADVRLDYNQLTGTLPTTWSAWGNNTGNSLQLSIRNTSLHGRMPKQWVQQFCLDTEKSGNPRVLFEPVDTTSRFGISSNDFGFGHLVQLPAQQASIDVTLAGKRYRFNYNNPDSVCGIAHAVRNTALLWGIFAAVLVATLICISLWQRRKPTPGPQGAFSSDWGISTILRHDKLHFARQVAYRVWFLVSDVGWTIYSQVTDAITIHQVFTSGKLHYAYILLAILLIPFAFMFILVVKVSIKWCQEKVTGRTLTCRAAAPVAGLLLAPILLVGLEVALIFHGIGVPFPAWWGSFSVDLVTFYRMQSVAEAFLSALPQSIVQSKLYLMGNDPNGIHVYIDTNLFLLSMIGSLVSVLKTVALIAIELDQYGCNLLGYGVKLVHFETFHSLLWASI